MVTVGLTGGIGSGKSTILETWEREGACVVRADELAKRIMEEDLNLKEQIEQTFGEEAYDRKGRLNRAYLSRAAFEKGRVEELNKLVHPKVRSHVKKRIKSANEQGFNAFVYEAALLLNHGRPDYLDLIVLVTAPRSQRIEWVSKRDASSPEQVEARMQRQLTEADMKKHADYVIQNNGTIDHLKQKALKIFLKILKEHK